MWPISVCLLAMAMSDPPWQSPSTLAPVIERFSADLSALERKYPNRWSERTIERFEAFYEQSFDELKRLPVKPTDQDSLLDAVLLRDFLEKQLARLKTRREQLAELQEPLPFLQRVYDFDDDLRAFEWVNPERAADQLNALRREAEGLRAGIRKLDIAKSVGYRAANVLSDALESLKHWYEFYEGYDPLFTWWCKQPYEQLRGELTAYRKSLLEEIVGISEDDTTTIVGDPIGREALLRELAAEHIPYTPEELIEIAEKEYAWCLAEMWKASRELGYGEDWHKALEHVKEQHVEPGDQPKLIRELAVEAIAFLEERDLITIPPLAKETWRMEMMSPKRQLESPFFLGGETILVSYPTDGMSHEAKLMSMRGNNRHFARATVHHELIPGHHLQGFMTQRFRPYRRLFSTPFWTEGWALYWEFLLWDKGFPQSPEDRIGMLFWRMHRCARIVFSLSFHLGRMSAQECVDYLVAKVGHERDNATAEVRRSFGGDYPPLYQCAYMLGALQFRRLRSEMVDSGRMSEKEFHDRILREGNIPVPFLRARLTGQIAGKDFRPSWRFYD
ncbi:MAG: DUF885 domain-containing protein [Armatimonadetes bacterium]|nr:MAG: DUF885 domain-containing protein [Armatimonadota bacterium]